MTNGPAMTRIPWPLSEQAESRSRRTGSRKETNVLVLSNGSPGTGAGGRSSRRGRGASGRSGCSCSGRGRSRTLTSGVGLVGSRVGGRTRRSR